MKPHKLTNEKGCSTYITQRYVDLEMPKHVGKSYRVCIFQPLVQAVFSRTNEGFFFLFSNSRSFLKIKSNGSRK